MRSGPTMAGPSPVAASDPMDVRTEIRAAMPAADRRGSHAESKRPVPSAISSAASVCANVFAARSPSAPPARG